MDRASERERAETSIVFFSFPRNSAGVKDALETGIGRLRSGNNVLVRTMCGAGVFIGHKLLEECEAPLARPERLEGSAF